MVPFFDEIFGLTVHFPVPIVKKPPCLRALSAQSSIFGLFLRDVLNVDDKLELSSKDPTMHIYS